MELELGLDWAQIGSHLYHQRIACRVNCFEIAIVLSALNFFTLWYVRSFKPKVNRAEETESWSILWQETPNMCVQTGKEYDHGRARRIPREEKG